MKHLIQYIEEVPTELFEMACVGEFGKATERLWIIVFTDDAGNIPHFHFFNNKNPNKATVAGCIKILEPEYFPHGGKYTDILNSKQKKQLVEFLKSTNKNIGISYWRYVIANWNSNNSTRNVLIDTPMPDYSKL